VCVCVCVRACVQGGVHVLKVTTNTCTCTHETKVCYLRLAGNTMMVLEEEGYDKSVLKLRQV
jgi:hypothetical protein